MVSTANECYGFPWLNILMKLHCLHLLWVNSQNWAGMDWDEWYKLFWSFSCKPSSSVKYHRITFDESKQLFWAWKDQIYILHMSRFLCPVCGGIRDLSRLLRLTGRRAVSCFEFLNEPWDCSQVKIPSLCVAECLCCVLQEGAQSLPKWTQHSIDRGTRGTAGEGHKRMRAERDRWMEEAEREDCEGGTDGAQKGDSSEEGNGGPRKEGNWLNREERYSRGDGIEEER